MGKKSDIQYIRLYTSGSAALSVDFSTPERKPKTRLPKPRKQRELLIRLDPIALCGVVVAAAMLILMVVGAIQLLVLHRQTQALETAVAQLQTENGNLRRTYAAGYDLEQVETMALALGLVPVDQVRHITVPAE